MSEELPIREGGAPELLQAKVRQSMPLKMQEMAAAADIPAGTPPEAAPAPALPETPAVTPDNPYVKELEALPDEDLRRLATEKGVKVDGRWGRDKLLQALVEAASAIPAPPAAAPVEPAATPEAPPAVDTVPAAASEG